jgi:hypothetical protein
LRPTPKAVTVTTIRPTSLPELTEPLDSSLKNVGYARVSGRVQGLEPITDIFRYGLHMHRAIHIGSFGSYIK